MFLQLGVSSDNLIMTDLDGVIYEGRKEGMNPYKQAFARSTKHRTLSEALYGADAVIGLSAKGAFSAEMISKMARDPIVFAMANPDPEVLPEMVLRLRPDAIMATGRSDYPNQVNNVLGFPFIFRGALDVRATTINEEMKLAAVRAIAQLAKQDPPENVVRAYGGKQFHFGREYLIPKPFDQRALLWVAPAVAEAAMETGVARKPVDLKTYREHLETLLGSSYTFMRAVKKRLENKKIDTQNFKLVLPEGEHPSILKAAYLLCEERIAEPILLGEENLIRQKIVDLGLTEFLKDVRIIQPSVSERIEAYSSLLFEKRKRKGLTFIQAKELAQRNNYYGPLMVEAGDADGVLNGVSQSYPETIRPAIHSVGVTSGSRLVGVYLMISRKRIVWFADATVNIDPSAEELSDIAIQTSCFASQFMVDKPKIAMLSFSNFGSNHHPLVEKVRKATEMIHKLRPDWIVDGEMQADTALNPEISKNSFPFNQVPGDANILIFPDLQSANIAYKLVGQLGEAEMIGPILLGMNKPIYVLSQNSSVIEIANMAALAVTDIRERLKSL
jgi:malate dehydrogenase (oxaloacetate-decarboxylating)(NADP+)